MGFRFSLAAVLRVKESIEKREELALLKAQFEVARVQRRIDELTDEIAKAGQESERALRASIEAFRLQHFEVERNAASEARQIIVETLQTLKQQRDAQMTVYRAAHSGRQMLTDLLARRRAEWEQIQARMEQKSADDVFAARFQRS